MSSDSDDAEPHSFNGDGDGTKKPEGIDFARIQHKMDNLPTIEKLMKEEDPNAYTEEQLQEAACFVRDLLQRKLGSEAEIEREQRRLHKKYRKVFKKSLLLAAYKHCLTEGAPPHSSSSAPGPSKRQMRREARQLARVANGEANVALKDVEELAPRQATPTEAASSSPTHAATERVPIAPCPELERFLVSKAPRSQSGVLVVTVFTSPYPDGQKFSCQWNCYYCPNEPDQPRSYLLNEPGVRRANRLAFDPYEQFTERVRSLVAIGHPADKVELLVLGGTWESYPLPYRTRFVRDLFYAANTIFDHDTTSAGTGVDGEQERERSRRPPLDLLQEQLINENARCKIIGVTLETRPDTINPAMLKELRRFGCTRVQLGVQHTDDAILTKVNRQSTREDAMRAIKLLKDSCFKVDIHLMPDLPGATPAIDKAMFDDVLSSPYLQADQWKIYPCQTTPFTVIAEWHQQGLYTPYGLENLTDVLLYAKARVQPWVRLNRVIRDIPVEYVLAGIEVTNARQLLAAKLQARGQRCRCIRCREVKADKHVAQKLETAELKERVYEASEGTETFLSYETPDEATIFGFLRLRTNQRNVECPFPELEGCALIRELHVYGNLIPTYATSDEREDGDGRPLPLQKAQHSGLGTRLLARAEAIARAAGYSRIAVISGVGVRCYYRRRGYHLHAAHCGGFLIKDLTTGDGDGGNCVECTAHEPTQVDATGASSAEPLRLRLGAALNNWWQRLSQFRRKRQRDD